MERFRDQPSSTEQMPDLFLFHQSTQNWAEWRSVAKLNFWRLSFFWSIEVDKALRKYILEKIRFVSHPWSLPSISKHWIKKVTVRNVFSCDGSVKKYKYLQQAELGRFWVSHFVPNMPWRQSIPSNDERAVWKGMQDLWQAFHNI